MASGDARRALPPHPQADPADRCRQRQHRPDPRAARAGGASRAAGRRRQRPAAGRLRGRGRRRAGRRGRDPVRRTGTRDRPLALAAARRRRTGRRRAPAAARARGHRPRCRHHRPQARLPAASPRCRSPDQRGRCQHRPYRPSRPRPRSRRDRPGAARPAEAAPRGVHLRDAHPPHRLAGPRRPGSRRRLLPRRGRARLAGHGPRTAGRHHPPRGDGAPAGGSGRTEATRRGRTSPRPGRPAARSAGGRRARPDLAAAVHLAAARPGLSDPGPGVPARQGSGPIARRARHPRLAVRPPPADPGVPAQAAGQQSRERPSGADLHPATAVVVESSTRGGVPHRFRLRSLPRAGRRQRGGDPRRADRRRLLHRRRGPWPASAVRPGGDRGWSAAGGQSRRRPHPVRSRSAGRPGPAAVTRPSRRAVAVGRHADPRRPRCRPAAVAGADGARLDRPGRSAGVARLGAHPGCRPGRLSRRLPAAPRGRRRPAGARLRGGRLRAAAGPAGWQQPGPPDPQCRRDPAAAAGAGPARPGAAPTPGPRGVARRLGRRGGARRADRVRALADPGGDRPRGGRGDLAAADAPQGRPDRTRRGPAPPGLGAVVAGADRLSGSTVRRTRRRAGRGRRGAPGVGAAARSRGRSRSPAALAGSHRLRRHLGGGRRRVVPAPAAAQWSSAPGWPR